MESNSVIVTAFALLLLYQSRCCLSPKGFTLTGDTSHASSQVLCMGVRWPLFSWSVLPLAALLAQTADHMMCQLLCHWLCVCEWMFPCNCVRETEAMWRS